MRPVVSRKTLARKKAIACSFLLVVGHLAGVGGSFAARLNDVIVSAPLGSAPVDWETRRSFALEQSALGTALAGDPTFQLHRLLAEWKAHWERGDADEYLGFYSSAFRPSGYYEGWQLRRWLDTRRSRLARAIGVEIVLDNVVLIWPREGRSNASTARIEFKQSYQSATFYDVVDKRLEVRRESEQSGEPGVWRIVREVVLREIDSGPRGGGAP